MTASAALSPKQYILTRPSLNKHRGTQAFNPKSHQVCATTYALTRSNTNIMHINVFRMTLGQIEKNVNHVMET